MEDTMLKLSPADALVISGRDARALVEAGNGDAALLYLHILRCGGVYDGEGAATALHRSDREIETAARRLCQMGLLTGGAPSRPPREECPAPVPQTHDIVRRSRQDRQFTELMEAVQRELGKKLSTPDLTRLFDIYDKLALPADVIFILINYCKEEYAARYGPDRSVGLSYIEKTAYTWFNSEILTCEQAEQWVEARARRSSALGRLQTALGLGGRPLSPTERKYLEQWLELGFSEDAVAVAADRTITRTGGLKWKYADAMIRSWHQQGLHTPEEIEAGDRKPVGAQTHVSAPSPADDRTLAQLARLREKMHDG